MICPKCGRVISDREICPCTIDEVQKRSRLLKEKAAEEQEQAKIEAEERRQKALEQKEKMRKKVNDQTEKFIDVIDLILQSSLECLRFGRSETFESTAPKQLLFSIFGAYVLLNSFVVMLAIRAMQWFVPMPFAIGLLVSLAVLVLQNVIFKGKQSLGRLGGKTLSTCIILLATIVLSFVFPILAPVAWVLAHIFPYILKKKRAEVKK